MELRHLRYFIAVAEELHFRRAAQRLHLAQPALSQQIKDLEVELGVVLFERTSRRVELSEAGRILLKEARVIINQVANAVSLVKSSKSGDIGLLKIGFVASASYSILPTILREFNAECPKIELQCFEMPITPQIEALRKNEIDVGFIRMPANESGITFYPLFSEGMVMVLPKNHPAAEKESVSLTDFAKDNYVLFPRQKAPGLYDQILGACRKAGFSPQITQECSELQTILGLVAAGLGVSIGAASMQKMRRDDVVYKTIPSRFGKFDLSLATHKEITSPIVRSFIEISLRVARAHKKSEQP